MPVRRCSGCGIDWQHKPRYAVCRKCGGRTDVMYNSNAAISDSEANHIEFEAYYQQRQEANAKALAALEAAAEAAVSPPDPQPEPGPEATSAVQPESD